MSSLNTKSAFSAVSLTQCIITVSSAQCPVHAPRRRKCSVLYSSIEKHHPEYAPLGIGNDTVHNRQVVSCLHAASIHHRPWMGGTCVVRSALGLQHVVEAGSAVPITHLSRLAVLRKVPSPHCTAQVLRSLSPLPPSVDDLLGLRLSLITKE